MATREQVNEFVQHHFRVEPELRQVLWIGGGSEPAPDAPVKLLEVNAATPATGSVEVFAFAPTADVPFRTEIAEITPEELERLRSDASLLPGGWDLGSAVVFDRPDPAE